MAKEHSFTGEIEIVVKLTKGKKAKIRVGEESADLKSK